MGGRLIFKVTVGLSEAGIRVNSVLPGIVEGERLHRVYGDQGTGTSSLSDLADH